MDSVNICENKIQAAKLLSMSVRSIERLIAAKEIKVVKKVRRVLILRRSLEEWARKNAR